MNIVNNSPREGYTVSPRMDYIDELAYNVERTLTFVACTVVLAPVAGAIKIIVGIFQAIIGVGATLFVLPNRALRERSWTHVRHGCGNIAAGVLEAIPFGAWIKYFLRLDEILKASKTGVGHDDLQPCWITVGQDEKYMPYPSIRIRKWFLHRLDDHTVHGTKAECSNWNRKVKEALNDFFEVKFADLFTGVECSLEEKVKIIEDSVGNFEDEIYTKIDELQKASPEYSQLHENQKQRLAQIDLNSKKMCPDLSRVREKK